MTDLRIETRVTREYVLTLSEDEFERLTEAINLAYWVSKRSTPVWVFANRATDNGLSCLHTSTLAALMNEAVRAALLPDG